MKTGETNTSEMSGKMTFEEYTDRSVEIDEQEKSLKVNDIIPNSTKILFICESPHTEEVKCGYPLAGVSGKNMGKFFELEGGNSFGKYVFDNQEIETFKYGIMNVSEVPLQKIKDGDVNNEEQTFFEYLNIIRKGKFKTVHGDGKKETDKDQYTTNDIKGEIKEKFEKRLEETLESEIQITHIICCGNFAKDYFTNTINQLDGWGLKDDEKKSVATSTKGGKKIKILYLPHPSTMIWESYNRFKSDFEYMKNIMNI